MCTMKFTRLPRNFYCSFCLCLVLIFLKKNMLGQKKIFNWFYWKYFTFSYLQPLIFCDRGTIPTCSLCVRAVIQDKSIYRLLHSKLFVHKEIFQSEFSDMYLLDMITLFFCRRKSFSQRQFQTFYDFYTQEVVEKPFFVVVWDLFRNCLQSFLYFCGIFNQNKPSAADENDLALVYYSISVDLCKKIVKIYALYADSNCLEYISDSYKKQQVFTSKSTVFYSQ